jgi:hypothetical protein
MVVKGTKATSASEGSKQIFWATYAAEKLFLVLHMLIKDSKPFF